ncbi:phytanoyl-CoA dioxygenase family protein [Variovorax sp. KK3]|uniref:phytanoyl-CoA dioxygenase family protein n=1 Tax=Variovorax sp. KK3 TaxID=1855728 RepID=UPI00097C3E93|nr:phytanoyl-CoA dioxygenase family protein [Variovorax sp. KK3]
MSTMTPGEIHARFERDGVVRLPQALEPKWLQQAERAYQWSIDHGSRNASNYNKDDSSKFYVDTGNPEATPVYADFLTQSPVRGLVSAAWASPLVLYAFEQVFYKEGGSVRSQRTGWHQDSSYLSFEGHHLAVMWITFEPVAREHALEFVRGSHRGPLFEQRGAEQATRPLVPKIEADREQFDIVGWPIEPGDVLLFHPATLHGGGGTEAGKRRRTLSLRFVGEDTHFVPRPAGKDTPPSFLELNERLREGDPFRHPSFLQLHPRQAA